LIKISTSVATAPKPQDEQLHARLRPTTSVRCSFHAFSTPLKTSSMRARSARSTLALGRAVSEPIYIPRNCRTPVSCEPIDAGFGQRPHAAGDVRRWGKIVSTTTPPVEIEVDAQFNPRMATNASDATSTPWTARPHLRGIMNGSAYLVKKFHGNLGLRPRLDRQAFDLALRRRKD